MLLFCYGEEKQIKMATYLKLGGRDPQVNLLELIEIVETVVCSTLNINHQELHARCRKRKVSEGRAFCWLLIMDVFPTSYSHKKIAKIFGKSHCDVYHAEKRHSNLLEVKNREYTNSFKLVCMRTIGILKSRGFYEKSLDSEIQLVKALISGI